MSNTQVMDALKMDWPDNSFDLVWACESGEHMPDKKRYVEEMTRVLKPGALPVHTLWCTSMHLHQQKSCFIRQKSCHVHDCGSDSSLPHYQGAR